MSKVKYYYDSETLSYKQIPKRKRRYLGLPLLFISFSLLAGFGLWMIAGYYFQSPQEIQLKRELAFTKLNYEKTNKKLDRIEGVLADIEERDNNVYRVYFEVDPITEDERKSGYGGINRYKELEGYNNSELVTTAAQRLNQLEKRLVVQSESLDEIALLAEDKADLLESVPAIQPVKNEDLKRMASGYGYRSDPFTKVRKFHYGMDFSAVRGTPIYAAGNGKVKRADNGSSGYGNHIRIDHGFGYVSLYAHLYKYNVRVGQQVKRGDLIGFVGSTGRSIAPHLHYEVFKDGERINPMNFYYGRMSPEEFNRILKESEQANQSLD